MDFVAENIDSVVQEEPDSSQSIPGDVEQAQAIVRQDAPNVKLWGSLHPKAAPSGYGRKAVRI